MNKKIIMTIVLAVILFTAENAAATENVYGLKEAMTKMTDELVLNNDFSSGMTGQETTAENIYFLSESNSRVITFNYTVKNIAIGDPQVADVIINSGREIIINGKKAGITTLAIWDGNNKYQEYKIVVGRNSADLSYKSYKLNNVLLVDYKYSKKQSGQGVIEYAPSTMVESLKTVLSSFLDPSHYAVDPDRNTVMVIASEKDHKQVSDIINKVDTKQPQVMFEVVVYELKENVSFEHELQLAFNDQHMGGEINNVNNVTDTGFGLAKGLSYAFKHTGYVDTTVAESASHVLTWLETEGKAKILAKPQIICRDSEHSWIHAGEKYPLVSTDQDGKETVTYLDTGVILSVIPNIGEDDRVNCFLNAEVSSISGYSAKGYPNISTRETLNQVSLADGQFFVMAGLLSETENISKSKVPILGDLFGWVPLIGKFFNNEKREKITKELVVTLRPTIVGKKTLVSAEVK